MRRLPKTISTLTWALIAGAFPGMHAEAAQMQSDGLHLRVGAYNVSFFSEASGSEIGSMLKTFDLDIAGLTEVPRAPATNQVAAAMEAEYHVTGTISSGESDDKLKAIVSHSPLAPMSEIDLSATQGGFVSGGESATHTSTQIAGYNISVYCLHISDGVTEPMEKLLNDSGFAADNADVVLVIGDFNARIGDPQMQMLMNGGFHPIWSDLGIDTTQHKTYDLIPGRGPNGEDRDEGVIDHTMLRGQGVRAIDGGIVAAMTSLGNPMSDHALVWAELVITPVPEPKGFSLFAMGFLAVACHIRKTS